MKKLYITVICLVISFNASAIKVDYYGVVNRIAFLGKDGSFLVAINSRAFDDCLNKYAYFTVDKIGKEKVDIAYSMALTSMSAKKKMNFVIDKDKRGLTGECYVEEVGSGVH